VNDCSAACDCPTETSPSACLRIVSGFVMGAMLGVLYMVGEASQRWVYACVRDVGSARLEGMYAVSGSTATTENDYTR
jgi:hypothetical protein